MEEKQRQEQSTSKSTEQPQSKGLTSLRLSSPWDLGPRTTLLIACDLLEPEAHNIKEIRARMKYGEEKLKYYHDHRGTKELAPLKPGDFVRMKPETGSKEWKAATVV